MKALKILDLFIKNGHIINQKDKELLLNLNPKQMISNTGIDITIFEVEYDYTTVRGNRKNGKKYFVKSGLNPERDMVSDFNFYINKFNENNQERKLLNVKFLNSRCLGYMSL